MPLALRWAPANAGWTNPLHSGGIARGLSIAARPPTTVGEGGPTPATREPVLSSTGATVKREAPGGGRPLRGDLPRRHAAHPGGGRAHGIGRLSAGRRPADPEGGLDEDGDRPRRRPSPGVGARQGLGVLSLPGAPGGSGDVLGGSAVLPRRSRPRAPGSSRSRPPPLSVLVPGRAAWPASRPDRGEPARSNHVRCRTTG
jgi:hypothetical protein